MFILPYTKIANFVTVDLGTNFLSENDKNQKK